MDKSSHNIDLLFRNGLREHEVHPVPDLWDGIAASLPASKARFVWNKAAAVAVLLVTSGFLLAGYLFVRNGDTDSYFTAFDINYSEPLRPESSYPSLAVALPEKGDQLSSSVGMISLKPGTELHEPRFSAPAPASTGAPAADLGALNKLFRRSSESLISAVSVSSGIKNINPLQSYGLGVLPGAEIAGNANDNLNGQNKDDGKWALTAMASPTYFSRFGPGTGDLSQQMIDAEEPQLSYSGGLALSFRINKRLSIQSGLYYSSLGQEINGIDSYGGFQRFDYSKGDYNFEVVTGTGPVLTRNGDVFLSSPGQPGRVLSSVNNDVFDPRKANLQYLGNSIIQNFSYIEMPLVLRYKIIDRNIDLNMSGGVSYNLLVGNTAFTPTASGKFPLGETMGVNAYNISSSLGMGMEYSFNSKFSMNIEPTFRYYINPFSKMTGTGVHPYSFGIFSGLSYKF